MAKPIKIEHCTSCGSKNIEVNGNQYYCPECDKTAKVTEQGTKVIDKNPLGKEKARIDRLEDDVAELKGKEPAEEKGVATEAGDKAESRAAAGEDENDQDGFISIEP